MDLTWQEIWYKSKIWLGEEVGMSNDQMHVNIGLAVFLFLAVLLRNLRFGMLLAWLVVVAMVGLNEVIDGIVWIDWTGAPNWIDSTKDVAITLFWPTMILLLRPWIGARR